MGATSELVIDMKQQETASEYDILIDRLKKKDVPLSYSSLKAFGKSPKEFIKYKLEPRKPQTESQIFGSLCDCFLTTPDEFENMFSVIDKIPSSELQIAFAKDMIEGATKEQAFSNNYKSGSPEKVYSGLEDYINAHLSGKMICTQSMKDEAEKIVENLKKSELVMQYVNACHLFQNKKEWNYGGWKFRGFTDAEGEDLIIDFKYSRNADPDKFERDIMNYDYFMQMGMYADSLEGLPECYFIVYDKSLNFSVIKVDYSLLNYGLRKYRYLVQKLNQCIEENRFNESYNFFDVQLRTVYKPKWVKGFETDVD